MHDVADHDLQLRDPAERPGGANHVPVTIGVPGVNLTTLPRKPLPLITPDRHLPASN